MKYYEKIRVIIAAICLMMSTGCIETKSGTSLESDTSVNTEQKQLIDDNSKDIYQSL